MLIDSFTKKDYTQDADKLVAINPRWQKQVKKWGEALRLVDYWVDRVFITETRDRKRGATIKRYSERQVCYRSGRRRLCAGQV